LINSRKSHIGFQNSNNVKIIDLDDLESQYCNRNWNRNCIGCIASSIGTTRIWFCSTIEYDTRCRFLAHAKVTFCIYRGCILSWCLAVLCHFVPVCFFRTCVVKIIGSNCSTAVACCFCEDYITHSSCVDQLCQCDDGYYPNQLRTVCLPRKTKTPSFSNI